MVLVDGGPRFPSAEHRFDLAAPGESGDLDLVFGRRDTRT